jgi:hypothetical protein
MPEPTPNPLTRSTTASSSYERRRAPHLVAAILTGFILFLVIPGVFSIWFAFSQEQPLAGRLLFLALAACSLFLPAWVAVASVRRKLTTGKWTPSAEERMQLRAESAAKKFPTWIDPLIAAANLFLAAVYVFLAVRDESVLWYVIAAVWILIALQSLWQFYRKFHRSTPAT